MCAVSRPSGQSTGGTRGGGPAGIHYDIYLQVYCIMQIVSIDVFLSFYDGGMSPS